MPSLLPTLPVTLEIMFRCLVVYGFVLLALRLSGKRQIGQMSPLDLVLLLLLSNSVQNAMTGPDTTLLGGIIAATTLVLLNRLLSQGMLHNRGLRKWLQGSPTILVNHGQIVIANMQREKIDHDELLQAFREHGVLSLHDVRMAVLEMDGYISVILQNDLSAANPAATHRRIHLSQRTETN
jgi:uncharacterized membrane protein YcaP (DUF421 family)